MKELKKKLEKARDAVKKLPKKTGVFIIEEAQNNFEKQSFYGEKWKGRKKKTNTKKLLQGVGNLRGSFRAVPNGNKIVILSNVPYAKIHNEGGIIDHPGGTAYFKDKGKLRFVSNRNARNKNYKRTKKHPIPIPKRQFIGDHPQFRKNLNIFIANELKTAFK